jgi:hypothetical protein
MVGHRTKVGGPLHRNLIRINLQFICIFFECISMAERQSKQNREAGAPLSPTVPGAIPDDPSPSSPLRPYARDSPESTVADAPGENPADSPDDPPMSRSVDPRPSRSPPSPSSVPLAFLGALATMEKVDQTQSDDPSVNLRRPPEVPRNLSLEARTAGYVPPISSQIFAPPPAKVPPKST